MKENVLVEAGIDYEGGIRRCGGNAGLYERLLGLFVQDNHFEMAKDCLDKKDYEGLFSNTHEIKGMSGNMSITGLYDTSSEVVALLRAEDYDALPEAFSRMSEAYTKAITAINNAKE